MRLCSVEDCGRKHDAKGMCRNHYNRARYTKEQRHKRVPIACDACGEVVMKFPSKRFAKRFCSLGCRDYDRYGPASCLIADKPRPVAASTPKAPRFIPERRECAWCGESFTATTKTKVLCSESCKRRAKHMRRRGRESIAGGTYTWAEVMRLFLAFGKCCAYCEQPVVGQPEPDHVIPISRGGSNSITNILPACSLCNADKRDLLLSEWNDDRKRRGLTPRVTTWASRDQRLMHLVAA